MGSEAGTKGPPSETHRRIANLRNYIRNSVTSEGAVSVQTARRLAARYIAQIEERHGGIYNLSDEALRGEIDFDQLIQDQRLQDQEWLENRRSCSDFPFNARRQEAKDRGPMGLLHPH